jgi:uncharacterized protein YjiS (DUF1127 family)
MYTYEEAELQRLARVRSELKLPDGRVDLSELHREVARARAEAIAAFASGIGRLVGRAARRVGKWRRYRAAIAELENLDLRTLDDIGISRADIPRVAAGLWMPPPVGTAGKGGAALANNENARKVAA